MPKKLPAPVGAAFGSWTVLAEAEPKRFPSGCSRRMMRCECKCGHVAEILLCNLTSKKSTKCNRCASTKHGVSETPEYNAWKAMNQRCYDKKDKKYMDYGGRGVYVCERWRRDNPNGLKNFLADMGPRPSSAYSLDKDIVKPGNLCYCPEYCCWALLAEQNLNRRSVRVIEFQGRKQCIAAWAKEQGINKRTIGRRLDSGWTVEDALTRPSAKRKATS